MVCEGESSRVCRCFAEGESELNEREVGERERKRRRRRRMKTAKDSRGMEKGGRLRTETDGRRRSGVEEGKVEEWFTCIASIAPAQGQGVCETEDQTGSGPPSFQFPAPCPLSLSLYSCLLLLPSHPNLFQLLSFFVAQRVDLALRHDETVSLSITLRLRSWICWRVGWIRLGGYYRFSDVRGWRRFHLFRYEGTYIYVFKENWRSGRVIVHIDKVNALALHPFHPIS